MQCILISHGALFVPYEIFNELINSLPVRQEAPTIWQLKQTLTIKLAETPSSRRQMQESDV